MGWSTTPAEAVDSRPITTIIGSELASTAEADRLLASGREWVGSVAIQCADQLSRAVGIKGIGPSHKASPTGRLQRVMEGLPTIHSLSRHPLQKHSLSALKAPACQPIWAISLTALPSAMSL